MAGSFKFLKISLLLCFFVGCNNFKEEETGKKIINDNINLFISNLYGVPSRHTPLFIIKEVGGNDFIKDHCESIIEMDSLNLKDNCKKDLYELINKEGYKISGNTKFISFNLNNLSNKSNFKLKTVEANINQKEYIELSFSNFFINKNKSFIIVQECDVYKGRIEGKVDVYYFEKKNSKWIYIKKVMLLTA
ncbi:hypothetical protein [Chryseobacterium sp. JAH]|uniref:hypothetical protein n=1 Tax=Chryseobacterium sp. JAH TaxID=1742858 RepID=UPI0007410481|nr:hypothetical protein [Chryseobacterium sp. JAH]KUJ50905.1 hypothetical protein AR685_11760 [Chryseobacterium sp. JAH]